MSRLIVHNNRILQGRSIDYELIDDFPVYENYPALTYSRPSDWLTMPNISSGEQVVHMLFAVYENSSNWLAFTVGATSPSGAGTYSVSWGDGTVTGAAASNATSRYDVQWSGVSASTVTTRGYRQAIVTISATQGSSLTSLNLNIQAYPTLNIPQDSQSGPNTYNNTSPNAVLDIKMAGPALSGITLNGSAYCNMLESFEFVGTNSITNFSNMFSSMGSIRRIVDLYTGAGINMQQMFYASPNLVELPAYLDTRNVTNMYMMFSDCTSIRNIPGMTTSNVTNMEQMFAKCVNLDVAPYFDTSSVTNMRFMFANCHYLNKFLGWNFLSYPIPSVYYDTRNVTNMDGMFWKCHSLQTIPQFNTTNVATMSYMFYQNKSLQSLPAGLTTSNAKTMRGMFRECHSLVNDTRMTGVPYMDTSSVTDMKEMFYQCYRVKTIPLFNTSNVTDMSLMFYNCIALQDLPLLNTATCSSMYQMFASCHRLETIPQFNTINVKTMAQMFYDCNGLRELPLLNTSNVINMHQMFWQNANNDLRSKGNLKTIPQFDTSKVITMYQMFCNCKGLLNIPVLNTSRLANMYQMFWNCTNLREINMPNLSGLTNSTSNYSAVAAMNIAFNNQTTYSPYDTGSFGPYYTYMPDTSLSTGRNFTELFRECTNLRKVAIYAPTVTNATNMFLKCTNLRKGISLTFSTSLATTNSMFVDCFNLKDAPLFETAGVSDMTSMFQRCYSLRTVPLYNTFNVQNMTSMFNNTTGGYTTTGRGELTSVPLFNTINVATMSYMFMGCINLKEIPAFNTFRLSNMIYMFSGCTSLKTIPVLNLPSLADAQSGGNVVPTSPLYRTFLNCSSLEYIPATFTYSTVLDMSETFRGCSNLRYLADPFNLRPKRLYKTFESCARLSKIPSMDVSACTNFKYAFNGCNNLTEIGAFTMSSTTDSYYNYSSNENGDYPDNGETYRTYNFLSSCTRLSKIERIRNNSTLVLNGLSLNYSEILKVLNNMPTASGNVNNLSRHQTLDARVIDIRRNPGTSQLTYIDRKIAYDKYWNLPGYGYQHDQNGVWRHPIAALGNINANIRSYPMFYNFIITSTLVVNKVSLNNMPLSIASSLINPVDNKYYGAFYIPEPANTDRHSIDNGAPSNAVLDFYNSKIYDFWTWKISSTYSFTGTSGVFFSATAAQANYLAAGMHALTHSVYEPGNQHKYDLTTYVTASYTQPTVVFGSASYRTLGAVYDGTLASKWMRTMLKSVPSNPSWRYSASTTPVSNVWFKFRPAQTGTVSFAVWTGPSSSNVIYGTQRRSQIAIWESDGATELASSGWTYSLSLNYATYSAAQHYSIEYMSITASAPVTASSWYYISVDVAFDGNQGTFTLATWWI